jgi:uncharacterized metal-binding protein YceD (DUF177 family)
VSDFVIQIYGLSNKVHRFDFEINDIFFSLFEGSVVEKGNFTISVSLHRTDTMLTLDLHVRGDALLECDRTLEEFSFPVDVKEQVIYKYGESYKELDDGLFVIPLGTESIDLSSVIYEVISVEIPMKRLHPRFENEYELDDDLKMIYTSEDSLDEEEKEQITDPRWNKLKDLNNK